MSLRALLSPHGFVHRDDLLERRWSPDAIRRATRDEGLQLLRRRWVVRPDAHPAVRSAAAAGGRVTCVTAAAAVGLWITQPVAVPHLALPPHSGSACSEAVVHRAIGVVPAPPRDLFDPIENVLSLLTRCLDEEQAHAAWESAVRKGLMSCEELRAIAWRNPAARRLAKAAAAASDSGLESLFVRRLRRLGIVVLQQVLIHGHHVDGLIGSRLVLQIDGFSHHRERQQRRADLAHDRELRLLGYTVFRYSYEDVMFDWPRVEAEVRAALARGLHLAR